MNEPPVAELADALALSSSAYTGVPVRSRPGRQNHHLLQLTLQQGLMTIGRAAFRLPGRKNKEPEMGLKLHHLDTHGSAGDLDGQPFRLEASDTGWRAEIGRVGSAWVKEGALNATRRRAAGEIRNMTYQAVAMYRQFQRHGAVQT